MASSPLKAEQIKELLTLAREGNVTAFKDKLAAISNEVHLDELNVMEAAIEPDTENSILHMAAGNGHSGIVESVSSKLPRGSIMFWGDWKTERIDPRHAHPFVNYANNEGSTALHWAARNGHMDAVKALIAAGANSGLKNKNGKDSVYEAENAECHDIAIVVLDVRPGGDERPGPSNGSN